MRRVLVLLWLSGAQLFAQASDAVLERYYQEGETALAESLSLPKTLAGHPNPVSTN